MVYLKKLTINKTTSTIVLEHNKIDNDIDMYLKSIAIILGGYNEFGRHIPPEDYKKIHQDFKDLIYEIKQFKKS